MVGHGGRIVVRWYLRNVLHVIANPDLSASAAAAFVGRALSRIHPMDDLDLPAAEVSRSSRGVNRTGTAMRPEIETYKSGAHQVAFIQPVNCAQVVRLAQVIRPGRRLFEAPPLLSVRTS